MVLSWRLELWDRSKMFGKYVGPLIYTIGVYRGCLYRAENVVLFQLVTRSLYRPLSVAYVILYVKTYGHLWSATIIFLIIQACSLWGTHRGRRNSFCMWGTARRGWRNIWAWRMGHDRMLVSSGDIDCKSPRFQQLHQLYAYLLLRYGEVVTACFKIPRFFLSGMCSWI
jgi:hypothetical protein